jgi:hypothetical protein
MFGKGKGANIAGMMPEGDEHAGGKGFASTKSGKRKEREEGGQSGWPVENASPSSPHLSEPLDDPKDVAIWALAEEIGELGLRNVTTDTAWPLAKKAVDAGYDTVEEIQEFDDDLIKSIAPKDEDMKMFLLVKRIIGKKGTGLQKPEPREEITSRPPDFQEGLAAVLKANADAMESMAKSAKVKVVGVFHRCGRVAFGRLECPDPIRPRRDPQEPLARREGHEDRIKEGRPMVGYRKKDLYRRIQPPEKVCPVVDGGGALEQA